MKVQNSVQFQKNCTGVVGISIIKGIELFVIEEEQRVMMATMGRFLMALETEGPGGQSLLGSIKIAVLPIVKVFTMCALGLLMASKYVNILPASGRRLLNGVCMCMLYVDHV